MLCLCFRRKQHILALLQNYQELFAVFLTLSPPQKSLSINLEYTVQGGFFLARFTKDELSATRPILEVKAY